MPRKVVRTIMVHIVPELYPRCVMEPITILTLTRCPRFRGLLAQARKKAEAPFRQRWRSASAPRIVPCWPPVRLSPIWSPDLVGRSVTLGERRAHRPFDSQSLLRGAVGVRGPGWAPVSKCGQTTQYGPRGADCVPRRRDHGPTTFPALTQLSALP